MSRLKQLESMCMDSAAEVDRLRRVSAEMAKALDAANHFISNGIELGFIRMPTPNSGDPALATPGIIRAALSSYNAAKVK